MREMYLTLALGWAYLVSLENLTIFATHVIYNRLHLNDVRFERFSILRSLSFVVDSGNFYFACASHFACSLFLCLFPSILLFVLSFFCCVQKMYLCDFEFMRWAISPSIPRDQPCICHHIDGNIDINRSRYRFTFKNYLLQFTPTTKQLDSKVFVLRVQRMCSDYVTNIFGNKLQ